MREFGFDVLKRTVKKSAYGIIEGTGFKKNYIMKIYLDLDLDLDLF